jgi:hypothetical protein
MPTPDAIIFELSLDYDRLGDQSGSIARALSDVVPGPKARRHSTVTVADIRRRSLGRGRARGFNM